MKKLKELTKNDFELIPVWKFNDDGKTLIPIKKYPVETLKNCLVGTKVFLNNGNPILATIMNFKEDKYFLNEHLIILRLYHNNKWFELGRYFDADYNIRNPQKLCNFLGLTKDEVFPIKYDLTKIINSDTQVVKGEIPFKVSKELDLGYLIDIVLNDLNED